MKKLRYLLPVLLSLLLTATAHATAAPVLRVSHTTTAVRHP